MELVSFNKRIKNAVAIFTTNVYFSIFTKYFASEREWKRDADADADAVWLGLTFTSIHISNEITLYNNSLVHLSFIF